MNRPLIKQLLEMPKAPPSDEEVALSLIWISDY